jgi:hypothetical protein
MVHIGLRGSSIFNEQSRSRSYASANATTSWLMTDIIDAIMGICSGKNTLTY